MISRIFTSSLAAAALALFVASSASAAIIVLNPADAPAPGPATFQVVLDGAPNGATDVTVELRFSAEADLTAVSVATTGNPFLFPGVATSNVGCQDGAGICARFGGSSFGNVVPGPSIVLGELTVSGNPLDIIVSSTSRYTDAASGSQAVNVGASVGALTPEPSSLVLLGLAAAGLAFMRRRV